MAMDAEGACGMGASVCAMTHDAVLLLQYPLSLYITQLTSMTTILQHQRCTCMAFTTQHPGD